MKKIILFILILIQSQSSLSIESKIIYKIQNEIITSIDIKEEFKYLLALNTELSNLDNEKIFNISKQSIIKEKIKKIEILKYFKELRIDNRYTEILIKNIYTRLKLKTLPEFIKHLEKYDLDIKKIEEKITIDALWNELIIQKYSSKVEINEKKIKENIKKNKKNNSIDYSLSEIIYEIKNKEEINTKLIEIKKSIDKIGFENTASIYSFSESSKIGGNLGWINEKSLSNNIKKNLINLEIGDISQPIILSNGIMLLKINEVKKVKNLSSQEDELKIALAYEKSKQLNQYSKIHYNKIKKSLNFNE